MANNVDHPTGRVDQALRELADAAAIWSRTTSGERRDLLESTTRRLALYAREWVDLACEAKRIAHDSATAGEEIGAGPLALARYLRLLETSHVSLAEGELPPLPGPVRDGLAPVFPTHALADRLLFRGYRADVRLADGPVQQQPPPDGGGPCVVLGAGNVSSLPATDALHYLFAESRPVLLKLNSVNEYLLPIFERVFHELIDRNVLRIITGDPEHGRHAVQHELTAKVHLTGSAATHAVIAADFDGPFASELGNVTPVMIVPGSYSRGDLRYHAENIATMITNNASFNCIAAKLLVTCKSWPQRREFLDLVETRLAAIPPRFAYYPGALDRYARFCGRTASDDAPPWVMMRDLKDDALLLREESFVGVAGELALESDSPGAFVETATRFLNEKVWGNLGANIIAPPTVDIRHATEHLRYGTIAVNCWCGVSYALMTPPWGGYPGGDSGNGFVHNTFFLRDPIQTILTGPFRARPRPAWFATHRRSREVMWSLFRFYSTGGWHHLPSLLFHALRT